MADLIDSISDPLDDDRSALLEKKDGLIVSPAYQRWNSKELWTLKKQQKCCPETDRLRLRPESHFLDGAATPDHHDAKESFVCFTKPNLHSSELVWHIDNFLDLRHMTAPHGLSRHSSPGGLNLDDVIFSPVVETRNQHRWRVALFPNGTNESKGHVGVYVLVQNEESDVGAVPSPKSRDTDVSKILKQATSSFPTRQGTTKRASTLQESPSAQSKSSYQQWQNGLRSWPDHYNVRNKPSLAVKRVIPTKSSTRRSKRYYLKFSLTIVDIEGTEVPGTRVQQAIQSVESGSFWGFPKYLTVLDEADLARFLNALGGCLRLHVTVELCNAIRSTLPGVSIPSPARSQLVSGSSSSQQSVVGTALLPAGSSSSSESVGTHSSGYVSNSTSSSYEERFLEQLREALVCHPEELFDLDIFVGPLVKLKANRLILTTRCPALVNDVLEFEEPARATASSTAKWPFSEEDPDVVSALLQYIHFDSCDLITEVNSRDLTTQLQLIRLREIAAEVNLESLVSVLDKMFFPK